MAIDAQNHVINITLFPTCSDMSCHFAYLLKIYLSGIAYKLKYIENINILFKNVLLIPLFKENESFFERPLCC